MNELPVFNFKAEELRSLTHTTLGWDTLTIVNAELKPCRSGKGHMLFLTMTGSNNNSVLAWIIIRHDSKVAEQIGLAKLLSVMDAVGLKSISSPASLVGKTLSGEVESLALDDVDIPVVNKFGPIG